MKIQGVAHKYGANVDTDAIIPAAYLSFSQPEELGKHCLEGIDPEFVSRVKPGDIIVAGPNFGCGSSREHAPIAIKAVGVSCVIAPSFARLFRRNARNIGLLLLESETAAETEAGDILEVNMDSLTITNLTQGKVFSARRPQDAL